MNVHQGLIIHESKNLYKWKNSFFLLENFKRKDAQKWSHAHVHKRKINKLRIVDF